MELDILNRTEHADPSNEEKESMAKVSDAVAEMRTWLSALGKGVGSGTRPKGKGKGDNWAKGDSWMKGDIWTKGESWTKGDNWMKGDGKSKGKSKGKGKDTAGKGGKGDNGKGKTLTCYTCGGVGHPARLCPSEKWVGELGDDVLAGDEGALEYQEWSDEEDGGAIQMAHLEDPEEGWTLARGRRANKASRRAASALAESMQLGTLLDDANDDLLLNNVLDGVWDKSGYIKIAAVVDSGAEANALPSGMASWLPLKPSVASRAGKVFRGAGGDPIPAEGERVTIGKTAEGQARKVTWEVCPVKRPLLSVAKITKAGNMVHMTEQEAYIKHLRSGQITKLRRERNVWMMDMWIRKPANAMEISGFRRQGA